MATGALVTYTTSSSNIVDGEKSSVFAASGIKFERKWVLIHGTLLAPLKMAQKILNVKTESKKSKKKLKKMYSSLPPVYVKFNESNDTKKDQFVFNISVKNGRIVHLWKCSLLARTVEKLLCDWNIGNKQESKEQDFKLGKLYLSVFALVYIGDGDVDKNMIDEALLGLYENALKRPPIRGEEVFLESTPFGNELFLNSKTSGIVSNCVGYDNCLLLTDASATSCCEGGPAFLEYRNMLFGIIINSLCWWRGEWVGITLVACLAPCLYEKISTKISNPSADKYISTKKLVSINLLDSIVVLVRCGSSWGSGISLGKGYFLTCSHVVMSHESSNVTLYCRNKTTKANVLFRSPNDKAYDLALLHANIENFTTGAASFASTPAIKGETVMAVGYPYFSEETISNIRPTISKGQITNITPYMLQTSCCIQSGYSGGPIMRFYREPGKMHISCDILGVIVCNARNDVTEVSYPHINMAIPVIAFKDALKNAMESSLLSSFEDKRQSVQLLWKFQVPKSKF